jgi:hypothetical protein
MDVVWIVVMAGGLALLVWWAFRTDPHWVAKDGRSFTCKYQRLGRHLTPEGRWLDGRAVIDGDSLFIRRRGRLTGVKPAVRYRVIQRGEPSRSLVIYLIDTVDVDDAAEVEVAALRIPRKSRAVAELDRLAQPAN